MSNLSLVPVPSEPAASACANCGASILADQRYCLSCGQPVSPVRLAFLDVLESDGARQAKASPQLLGAPETIDVGPFAYVPVAADGVNGWLRRYSGLLSLLSVLTLCLLVGLLVGHWVTQSGSKAPARQVLEVKGLAGLPAASAAPTSTTSSESSAVETESGKTSATQDKKEAEAGEHETKAEKAPPPPAKKVSQSKLKKLSSTTGKKHQEEINALGDQPIETG